MNQAKINELYELAHVVHEIRYEGSVVDPTIVSVHKQRVFDRYLFAQLIVRECLDTIQRGIDNGGGASEDIVMAGKLALFYSYRNIQYRFGMGDYKDQDDFGVEE